MSDTKPLPIVIAGPTASGKSSLAVEFALSFGGEVVNIDSVQLFRGCDIGSGKIRPDEVRGIRHHLIDIRDPDTAVNVSEICGEAIAAIEDIQARGLRPIIVAGTTMYVRSLFQGLAKLPKRDDFIRAELESRSNEALWAELRRCDPDCASKLHPNDRMRIIRALEVFRITNKSISSLHRLHASEGPSMRALFIVLCWKREEIHARIASRVRQMIADGLIEETKSLVKRWGGDAPALGTVGYAECIKLLSGDMPPENLLEEISVSTRQLAKRQISFWGNCPETLGWQIRPKDDEGETLLSESKIRKASRKISPIRVRSLDLKDLKDAVAVRLCEPLTSSEVWFVNASAIVSTL